MDKKDELKDMDAPQTFEDALQLAIRSLTEDGSFSGIPGDWLEALDREKASAGSESSVNQKLTITK